MARAGSVCVCVGSASWPECMCIVHPHAPPLRLHNAMDLCFDAEVVQGSGEQCVPTGGHGLWWQQKTANVDAVRPQGGQGHNINTTHRGVQEVRREDQGSGTLAHAELHWSSGADLYHGHPGTFPKAWSTTTPTAFFKRL